MNINLLREGIRGAVIKELKKQGKNYQTKDIDCITNNCERNMSEIIQKEIEWYSAYEEIIMNDVMDYDNEILKEEIYAEAYG
ncbi:MAG: hypothetical protein J5956_11330 [Ruminococcus sp.]|nr:hypothetical protein [Ruminococcus sp.]